MPAKKAISQRAKDVKKTKKRQKRTQYMCGNMLRFMRIEIKFEPRDMCAVLDLKRRTYQDYEAGKRGIPADLAARIREMHKRDREWIASIGNRVDAVEAKRKKGGKG